MTICTVHGAAKRCGILAGERLLSINGQAVRDVLDYRFYGYDRDLCLLLERPNGEQHTVRLRHDEGGDVGLEFENPLSDGERRCKNACIFCFIDQNPPNCRESLYFKDDDARLSFLLGNYITLTNVSEEEAERICRFRLSPLGISVHCTDGTLRTKMLGNPSADKLLPMMRRFAEAGIFMNCQIVLCPGVNDGAVLEQSLRDLAELGEQIISTSVVPVGLTRYREGRYPMRPVSPELARDTIRLCAGFQRVYCSDEMYLRAGLPIPEAAFYEDFAQLENGVGMMALFLEEWQDLPPLGTVKSQTIATGLAAAAFLEGLTVGSGVTVRGIVNGFFGDTVDVAGLLTGSDLVRGLRGLNLGERVLIASVMLRHGTDCFLDDMTVPELSAALGVPVVAVETGAVALQEALKR